MQSLQDADPLTKRGHLSIFLLLLPETVCLPPPPPRQPQKSDTHTHLRQLTTGIHTLHSRPKQGKKDVVKLQKNKLI